MDIPLILTSESQLQHTESLSCKHANLSQLRRWKVGNFELILLPLHLNCFNQAVVVAFVLQSLWLMRDAGHILWEFDKLMPIPEFTTLGAVVMDSRPAAVRANAMQCDLGFILRSLYGKSWQWLLEIEFRIEASSLPHFFSLHILFDFN